MAGVKLSNTKVPGILADPGSGPEDEVWEDLKVEGKDQEFGKRRDFGLVWTNWRIKRDRNVFKLDQTLKKAFFQYFTLSRLLPDLMGFESLFQIYLLKWLTLFSLWTLWSTSWCRSWGKRRLSVKRPSVRPSKRQGCWREGWRRWPDRWGRPSLLWWLCWRGGLEEARQKKTVWREEGEA